MICPLSHSLEVLGPYFLEAGDSIDDVDGEIEAVYLVEDG